MRYHEIIQEAPRLYKFSPKLQLLHGTSTSSWEEIQVTNCLMDDPEKPNDGISFTQNERIAYEFAKLACSRHDDETGVIIHFDGRKLAEDFELVPFHDEGINGDWHLQDEEELKIKVPRIDNIMKYVIDSSPVWRDSQWGE